MQHNLLKQLLVALSVAQLFSVGADAQSKKNKNKSEDASQYFLLKQLADADSLRLVEIYKDLHQHPELAFTETRTAAIVAKELKDLGYEVFTGIGKTGVAAILRNGDGPTVMYRSDKRQTYRIQVELQPKKRTALLFR